MPSSWNCTTIGTSAPLATRTSPPGAFALELLPFIGIFALLEAGCSEIWLTNDRTVIGIEADEVLDSVESCKRIHADDLVRPFAYAGTAGDRNQHMMSGRVN